MEISHTPVLLRETLRLLAPRAPQGAGELMVDATVGEGGHSFAFLSQFPELRVIGVDADPEIQAVAKERLREFGSRVSFYTGWSQDFFAELPKQGGQPDTILIDLGISLYHYEKSGRGFSFLHDEALDMRLDRNGRSAAKLIAALSERELADVLYYNAEERYSRRIARAIVEARARATISSSAALADIVARAVPSKAKYSPSERGRHPATKTFQALRIAVNGDLERLPVLLEAALCALAVGGRMGVISFHSLEDRIVKNFFRGKSKDCISSPSTPIDRDKGHRIMELLTRKGLVAEADEIKQNPPSRSARLRVIEKIFNQT
ncbi:MAG: 16S rRNA (cytosine(1402)-N(4))-methyltransferase RsmH [Treponema sp.]|jgi:16S rRNA (cytosine1402-N4)-methyltransferase|nr:16S rRNA (cytosine(1402)-N(4))-methyltransferase RsmH [Treponema sp.]